MAASPTSFLDYRPSAKDDEYDVVIPPGHSPGAGLLLEFVSSSKSSPRAALEFRKYVRGPDGVVGPAEILHSIRHKGDVLVGIDGVYLDGKALSNIQQMLVAQGTSQLLLGASSATNKLSFLRFREKKPVDNDNSDLQILEEEIKALEAQETALKNFHKQVTEEKENKLALKKNLQEAHQQMDTLQKTIQKLQKQAKESTLYSVKKEASSSLHASMPLLGVAVAAPAINSQSTTTTTSRDSKPAALDSVDSPPK